MWLSGTGGVGGGVASLILATKASWVPLRACSVLVVGKFAEEVTPVMYTLPALSTAIA